MYRLLVHTQLLQKGLSRNYKKSKLNVKAYIKKLPPISCQYQL